MRVFIVIPVFGNVNLTENFINSIELTGKERVILIDDNPLRLHAYFIHRQGIEVVNGNGTNFWGGSVNLGLDYISHKYKPEAHDMIILANNDVTCNFNLEEVYSMRLDIRNSVFHPQVKDISGRYVKSCGRIRQWFPFIVEYPLADSSNYSCIDTLTGRFLIVSWENITSVGGISKNLPHYGGDSDLGLKFRKIGVQSYLINTIDCCVNMAQTGVHASMHLGNLYNLLFNIKSSYCLKYRWRFVRNHKSFVYSILIMLSIYIKLLIAMIIFSKE